MTRCQLAAQLSHLDDAWAAVLTDASPTAVAVLLKVVERRATLLGLGAPAGVSAERIGEE